jgi:poly-gamma-glutamate synthesis protein (capsule biosynthesis protein)
MGVGGWSGKGSDGLWLRRKPLPSPNPQPPSPALPGYRAAARAAQPAETAFTLAAVGDILLDREVGKQITRHGTDHPFQHVGSLLSAADITIGNLECPLAEKGTPVTKRYSFRARPETVECLVRAGFDLLSLANNHSMDCGRTGLVETMETLDRAGLRWCGAGHTRSEAETAAVLTVKGLTIAFVGFCEFLPEGSFLREDRPTIAFASESRVRRTVAAARKRADVVVASFHWGVEYESRPHPRQKELARTAVAAGADLVLGHHPHVLQGAEVVRSASQPDRPALVAYSLGNFVFDPRPGRALQSVILRCTLSRRGLTSAEFVPIQIDGVRPRPAPAAERELILGRLTVLSAERSTQIVGSRVAFAAYDVSTAADR